MEFRIITQEWEADIKNLWAYCFEKEDHPFFQWYFSDYYHLENVFAGFHENKLVCCLHLNPYNIFLRGQVVPVSYVVGLATKPEARRGGVVGKMLTAAFAEMKRRGHYASLLMPSRAGFYYPYHYELCYHQYKYTVPLEELRSLSAGWGQLRPITDAQQADILQAVYVKFTAGKHGYVVRSRLNWQQLVTEHLLDKGYIYALMDGEQPAGYIMYALFDNKIFVKEMAFTCPEAQQALLQFIYNHRSQAERLEWQAPLDDYTFYRLPNPKQGVGLVPFMAARIIDVARLLTALAYQPQLNSELTFAVTDNMAPWNNQTFHLAVADGRAKVQAAGTAAADVSCSIGALSQLVFGRLRAQDLAGMGRLQAGGRQIEELDKIFPACVNYINEYY